MKYTYSHKQSSKAKAYKRIIKLMGANKKLLLELEAGRFLNKKPAHLHRSHYEEFDIHIHQVKSRDVITIGPREEGSDTIILYLHGGAYIHNLLRVHWNMIVELIRRTKATFVVPDYPLAPESNYLDVYDMVETVYKDVVKATSNEKIFVMGDSAGAGLALGLMQKMRNEHIERLAQIILLSPWLDVTMTNPEAKEVEEHDILLKVEGLRKAGLKYAGKDDPRIPMISPINGTFDGLGVISFFSSSDDVLVADSHKLVHLLEEQKIPFNYFEYPHMFHGWMTIVGMDEAKACLEQVVKLIVTADGLLKSENNNPK